MNLTRPLRLLQRTNHDTRVILLTGLTLAVGIIGVFFGFRYLPMVDLPQHAAQSSAWVHLANPEFAFGDQFELNFKTPYLLAYAIARLLAPLVGVVPALK